MFDERQAKVIMEQLLLVVDYMHQKNIIHRDLKLDNVLVNHALDTGELNVKIADFGLSTFFASNPRDKLFEKCGTPCYAAPEILRGMGYTQKCDIFSLGSIFFNLITGRFLFPASCKDEVIQMNRACDLSWTHEHLASASESCRSLIYQMLNPNPGLRPTARQALVHAWFKQDEEILATLIEANKSIARQPLHQQAI